MYLKCSVRRKDGKEHRSWSIVESRRLRDGRCIQRHVLYLGEITDSQREAWQKSIEVLVDGQARPQQLTIFPEDRLPCGERAAHIGVKLNEMQLHRPRQWGACWLGLQLWQQLGLDAFWAERLPASREGTRWDQVLTVQVIYQLIDPGSEWRLHRQWFDHSALGDLLEADSRLVADDTLYRCLDKLLEHKAALFSHLQGVWRDLFNARFDVLLYDLTSTYFECDVPERDGLRRFGYSRDKRPDCVQVVIALIVTPEGFPLGYEVLPGNTADTTTLREALSRIERHYGKARRTWVMDRGIPTEAVLEQMRQSDPPVNYLVGTPKGRLSRFEQALCAQDWRNVRDGVEVKLIEEDGELYVLAKSARRVSKERNMRRRRLKTLWRRLHELNGQRLTYAVLLMKLGAAKAQAGEAWKLLDITLPEPPQGKGEHRAHVSFEFALNKPRLRERRRREGRYLLRTNLCGCDPAILWQHYMTLCQIEEAFRNLKGDLALRPVYHQKDHRIEAHIFIAFLAYCLHITLRRRLTDLAPGLTPRAVLEKLATLSMIDVHLPTTDGRTLVLSRVTQPDNDCRLLLDRLRLQLPAQPPPRISAQRTLIPRAPRVVATF
jgi:hypothetical protein